MSDKDNSVIVIQISTATFAHSHSTMFSVWVIVRQQKVNVKWRIIWMSFFYMPEWTPSMLKCRVKLSQRPRPAVYSTTLFDRLTTEKIPHFLLKKCMSATGYIIITSISSSCHGKVAIMPYFVRKSWNFTLMVSKTKQLNSLIFHTFSVFNFIAKNSAIRLSRFVPR